MRYGFFAYESRKTSVNDGTMEPIAFAEVNYRLGGHEVFKPKLRSWLLQLLEQGRYEAGLFTCTYCEIVGESDPGDCLLELFVAWDGTAEVNPEPTFEAA